MLKFGLSTWLICPDKIPFRRYFGRKRKRKFEVGLSDGQIWASFLTNDVLNFSLKHHITLKLGLLGN